MIFSKSKRGKEILCHEGYTYNFDRELKIGQRYRCSKRYCTGIIVLNTQHIIIKFTPHMHDSNELEIRSLIAMNEIKSQALELNDLNTDIITNITCDLKDEVSAILPSFEALRDKITKIRNKKLGFTSFNYEDIPPELKINKRGETFLQFDSGVLDEERFLIFFSTFSKKYIELGKIFLLDGTFKTCPSQFYQIYSFHSLVLGKSTPLAYCLLSKKTESIYFRLFTKLKELTNLNPIYIIIDFEIAVFNSLKRVFNTAFINGCTFHYSQSILKNIQKLGLYEEYLKNEEFNKIVKMFLNIVFFPINEIEKGIALIKEKIENLQLVDKFSEFYTYFNSTYHNMNLGKNINKENKALFDVNFWSAYQRTTLKIPRTINSVEAWHRSLNFQSFIAHPNIAKFIDLIKRQEEKSHFKIIQRLNGNIEVNLKSAKYEEKLRILVKDFDLFDINDFFEVLDKVTRWKF